MAATQIDYLFWQITSRFHKTPEHSNMKSDLRGDELSTIECRNFLVEVSKLQPHRIVFYGGDIFLRKDLLELIKFAKSLDMLSILIVNGFFIDEKTVVRIADAGVDAVVIPIEGPEAFHNNLCNLFKT